MPHPASRVLAMLEMLQGRQRVTGAELAAALGVDERTVRRYATTLAEIGIPVAANRGRYGGYRLSPDQRIPPLMLTDSEAVAVVLGLATADHLGLANHAPALAVALAKVHRLLPARLVARLAAVQAEVGFPLQPRSAGVRPGSPALLALAAATRERRRVSLSHRLEPGAERLVQVDPYGLAFHSGRWYVAGRVHPEGDLITLPVDRIGAVDVGGEASPPPEGFDALTYLTRAGSEAAAEWEVEVLLETDPALVRQRLPDPAADVTETADGVLVRARFARLEAAATLLAGLGCPFTILRPAQLRAVVTDYAAQLARYAQRSAPARP